MTVQQRPDEFERNLRQAAAALVVVLGPVLLRPELLRGERCDDDDACDGRVESSYRRTSRSKPAKKVVNIQGSRFLIT